MGSCRTVDLPISRVDGRSGSSCGCAAPIAQRLRPRTHVILNHSLSALVLSRRAGSRHGPPEFGLDAWMNSFAYACPHCSRKNVISAGNVGNVVRCLHCKQRVAWEGETPIPAADTPPAPPRKFRWRNTAAGALCLVIALPTLGQGCWHAWLAHSSNSWPSTSGIVTSSTVKEAEENSSHRSAKPAVAASVRYSYQVDGAIYHNDTVRFGNSFSARAFGTAEATVKRHPRGPATVYYDPQDPDNSVLEPGLHRGNLIGPTGAGLLFAILGGVVLCNGLRRR